MRKLLLSSAFIAVTGTAALAQETGSMFRAEADPMEIRTSNLIGKRVYASETEIDGASDGLQTGWEDVGEVDDVIMSRGGSVEAVLVDIGGFLRMGERQVAVDMQSIRFIADSATANDESDFFLVMNAPRTSLEQAPEYSWEHDASDVAENTAEVAAEMARAAGENVEEAVDSVTAGMPITRDGYVTAEEADLNAEMLTGAPVYDANDEWVGEVSELLINTDGKITEAIVDVGGFLGIGEKPVELKTGELAILRADGGTDLRVYVGMTKEELEAMPTYDR